MIGTPEPVPEIFAAKIQLLDGYHALGRLQDDLSRAGPALLWLFLCDELWLTTLLAPHLQHSPVQILSDHRQRSLLRPLVQSTRLVHVATWATNRTMHDKTIVLPQLAAAYLTTANITRGSWTMSQNSFVRVESADFVSRLEAAFHSQWRAARPLLPSER